MLIERAALALYVSLESYTRVCMAIYEYACMCVCLSFGAGAHAIL